MKPRHGLIQAIQYGAMVMSNACVQLAGAAVRLAQAALSVLDLRQHAATHPRLGVVDHISCHPLGAAAQLKAAAEAACLIGAFPCVEG